MRSGGRRSGARGRGEQPAPRPGRAGPQSEHASIKKRRRASAGSDKCMCAAPHAGAGRRFTGTCFQEVRTNLRSGRELATLRPEQNILEVELGILLDAQCVRPERQARHAQHATGDRVPQGEPTQKAGHYSENRRIRRAGAVLAPCGSGQQTETADRKVNRCARLTCRDVFTVVNPRLLSHPTAHPSPTQSRN